jgi:chromosome segregation ATPase
MTALFVALGIMVLALLALLLWFVPHLLQQQAMRVAGETSQLREMLLDLLSEQEAVTMRQTQLGSSLMYLQDQLTNIAENGSQTLLQPQLAASTTQQIEARLSEMQQQIEKWISQGSQQASNRSIQDNEAWNKLIELLTNIQERVGTISQDRSSVQAGLQARELLEELEQEMQNLRSISEEIAMLQWRLRRSLHERQSNLSLLRSHVGNGTS